jgi:hypothetical protein
VHAPSQCCAADTCAIPLSYASKPDTAAFWHTLLVLVLALTCRPAADTGGKLLIMTQRGEAVFDWHLAKYGPAVSNTTAAALVVADPPDGCDAASFKYVHLHAMLLT